MDQKQKKQMDNLKVKLPTIVLKDYDLSKTLGTGLKAK